MTAVTFPTSLPGPATSNITPTERRLLSEVSGGPEQARGLQRDFLGTQQVSWDLLSPTQADILHVWWRDTLIQGGSWFVSTWLSPKGWVPGVRRFVGTPKWTLLKGGYWSVSGTVQVRGRGMDPQGISQDGTVAFLLHMDGPTNIVDEIGHTVSNGTPVPISTTQSKFGGASGYFAGGTIDYCSMAHSADFNIGTGDFQLEAWVYQTSARTGTIFNKRAYDNYGTQTWSWATTGLEWCDSVAPGNIVTHAAGSINAWHHYLVLRKSGVIKAFIDGVQKAAAACTYNFDNTNPIRVGTHFDHLTVTNMIGYMDDVRMIVGGSRYTYNFTPPTAPLTAY